MLLLHSTLPLLCSRAAVNCCNNKTVLEGNGNSMQQYDGAQLWRPFNATTRRCSGALPIRCNNTMVLCNSGNSMQQHTGATGCNIKTVLWWRRRGCTMVSGECDVALSVVFFRAANHVDFYSLLILQLRRSPQMGRGTFEWQ